MAKESRPSWDEYFMKIAEEVKTRSTCLRRRVGVVIVKEKRILSTGYNGAPSRLAHCLEIGCLRELKRISSGQRHELCRGLHAEQNAIIQAALYGTEIEGSILYSTHQPCGLCTKMLINAGIKEIVYRESYPDELAMSFIEEAGLKIRAI